jgi:hypothetical protein
MSGIAITAVIGADRQQATIASITRLGDASGRVRRVAGDLRQSKRESIDQPTSPRLRQHR